MKQRAREPPILSTEPTLLVSETFYSIQGESSYSGYPCIFIRLAGCNLRCTYCDARYTYDEPGKRLALSHLLSDVALYPGALVEITGGEPLLQENSLALMEALVAAGRTVLLETNGSIDISVVPPGVIRIMDVKCPGSGMSDKTDLENLQRLTVDDEVKFVISSEDDFNWAVDLIERKDLLNRAKILFSPNTRKIEAAELARLIMEKRLPVRLQVQLHTLLWPGAGRGV